MGMGQINMSHGQPWLMVFAKMRWNDFLFNRIQIIFSSIAIKAGNTWSEKVGRRKMGWKVMQKEFFVKSFSHRIKFRTKTCIKLAPENFRIHFLIYAMKDKLQNNLQSFTLKTIESFTFKIWRCFYSRKKESFIILFCHYLCGVSHERSAGAHFCFVCTLGHAASFAVNLEQGLA